MKNLLGRLLVLFLCLAPAGVHAAWVLSQGSERIIPGYPAELLLLIVNDTGASMDGSIPDRLPAVLHTTEGPIEIELSAALPVAKRDARPLAPGQFRKHGLRLIIPGNVDGPLSVELKVKQPVRVVLLAEPWDGSVATSPPEPSPDATAKAAPLMPTDTVPAPALQTHEPMYFVAGRRNSITSARFQLSFKYRLFDERSWLAEKAPLINGVYLGYSQTSLWDLSEKSSPFRDTAYRPSVFYFDPDVWSSGDGRHAVGFSGGFEHESNGRSDEDSRSINTLYVQPSWRYFFDSKWYVSAAPKLWTYVEKDENADIADYRGYGEMNLRLGRVDGWLFSALLRKGKETMGSVQLDASYPIRRPFFANAGGYVHLQYFNGYGESLLDYDEKGPSQWRLGVSIVR